MTRSKSVASRCTSSPSPKRLVVDGIEIHPGLPTLDVTIAIEAVLDAIESKSPVLIEIGATLGMISQFLKTYTSSDGKVPLNRAAMVAMKVAMGWDQSCPGYARLTSIVVAAVIRPASALKGLQPELELAARSFEPNEDRSKIVKADVFRRMLGNLPPPTEGCNTTAVQSPATTAKSVSDEILNRLRGAIRSTPEGKSAPVKAILKKAMVQTQTGRQGLRKLQSLGEYEGFAREHF